MNNDFARILTLLRKERNLSQKEASEALGISQALLSHYENGKRECGLDFLCAAADYYKVSCDYLLGRTSDRSGSFVTLADLPAYASGDSNVSGELLLEKRMTINSLNLIFSLLMDVGNRDISDDCSTIIMAAIYRILRILHFTDKNNPKNMFTLSSYNYCALSGGITNICEANAINIARNQRLDADVKSPVTVTPDRLSEKYPLYAPALLNLIAMVEGRIKEQNNLN